MQQVVRIGKTQYAAGLIWRALGDPRDKAGIRSIMDGEGGGALGLIVSSGDGLNVALGFPEKSSPITSGMSVLAMSVAKHIHTGLFVTPLPEGGGYWLCAVRDGLPVADGDFISSTIEDIREYLESLWFQVGRDAPMFVGEGLEQTFGQDRASLSLSDLVEDKQARITHLRGISPKKGLVTLAFAGAVILGVAGKMYIDMLAEQEAMSFIPDPRASAQQVMQEYMTSANAVVAPLQQDKAWALSSIPTSRTTYAAYAMGWTYQGMDCDIRAGQCQHQYKGSGLVDIFGLARHVGVTPSEVGISTDAKTATVAQGVSVTPKILTPADIQALPNQAMLTRMISQMVVVLQHKYPDLKWNISEPVSTPISTPSGSMPQNMPTTLRKGNIEITGRTASTLEITINTLEPLTLYPWHLVWSPVSGDNWKLELSYVAK